ncbi:RXT2-like protein [Geopyxis carbonaria]|nr:RXT2-like protein [Geopyxis carbonaria]
MTERQQVQKLIAKVKRTLDVQSDDSESDDEIAYTSNRGRKLKHRAKLVHERSLDNHFGLNGYKEEIEYYGKTKNIIYRKPDRRKRVAMDSDSEESEDSEEESGEEDSTDPYAGIQLEKLLAPLQSGADLPSHPSLAHIYTSTTLNELIQQSLDKTCEEHAHTIKLKNLLTKFMGDDPFVNLEKMVWLEDHGAVARARSEALFRDYPGFGPNNGNSQLGITSGSGNVQINGRLSNGTSKEAENVADDDGDLQMNEVNGVDATAPLNGDVVGSSRGEVSNYNGTYNGVPEDPDAPQTKDVEAEEEPQKLKTEELQDEETIQASPAPEPRRMTTRSANNNSHASPPSVEAPGVEIDPFFFPPNYSVDANYGLPTHEAEETRRLIVAAVQRQDEFLRGLNRLRTGLLRAERLRKKVWEWCRIMEGMRDYHQHLAEVSGSATAAKFDIDEGEHVGLSDGEDWYDMDSWGLEEPLEKGREEEEEGLEPLPGKKTRRGRG